jgi:hypothetical protein
MKHISTKEELVEVKAELGVREDWHEPDEQDVDVEVHGNVFDNAGAWGLDTQAPYEAVEKFIVLKKNGQPVAEVNLATLFAWASSLPKKDEQVLPDFGPSMSSLKFGRSWATSPLKLINAFSTPMRRWC